MTKSELIARLVARFSGHVATGLESVAKTIFVALTQGLANRRRVEIRRFGILDPTYRSARIGRNRKSGADEGIHAVGSIRPRRR